MALLDDDWDVYVPEVPYKLYPMTLAYLVLCSSEDGGVSVAVAMVCF